MDFEPPGAERAVLKAAEHPEALDTCSGVLLSNKGPALPGLK